MLSSLICSADGAGVGDGKGDGGVDSSLRPSRGRRYNHCYVLVACKSDNPKHKAPVNLSMGIHNLI